MRSSPLQKQALSALGIQARARGKERGNLTGQLAEVVVEQPDRVVDRPLLGSGARFQHFLVALERVRRVSNLSEQGEQSRGW